MTLPSKRWVPRLLSVRVVAGELVYLLFFCAFLHLAQRAFWAARILEIAAADKLCFPYVLP